jgi:hypothetical protein
LPLHDINDVMHSQKHKTQTSHENVHKPKHFCCQPIHDNELKHFMTTCPLSTLKDIANKFLVNNSIYNYNSPKFMIIYVTLYKILKKCCKNCQLLFGQHVAYDKYKYIIITLIILNYEPNNFLLIN